MRIIGNLFFMALVIFLAAAAAAKEKEEIYQAKPENIPAWAEQGNFRFIRIDGGRIESLKAERTFWGRDFSAEEKDVLAHMYDTNFEKMLGLLQDAGFNWIWVTWSNGWSLKEESENREQIKKVIERCHANGIRVTAYMSAVNMFRKSMYSDDPESKKWGLWEYGIPLFYAGINKRGLDISWERRLADVRKPEWRAYLLHKAELAVDAGVDAIFFDNIIGDSNGMKLLISEVQSMAERRAKETGKPKVLVYANVHYSPGRFDINDSCDLIWEEAGKDTPGVWDGNWQVSNAVKIKFLAAEKKPWQPLKFEDDVYHCGPREKCIPSRVEQKLSIAEAYTFGSDMSRNIEGRFLKGLIMGEKPALEAWAAIGQYNKFMARNSEVYHQVTPMARIALLSDKMENPAAFYLLKNNVVFETKVLQHLDGGVPLDNFKVLIIPFRVIKLNKEQREIISAFVAKGGKLFSADPRALAGELKVSRDKISAIPRDALSAIKHGQPAMDFLDQVEAASGGPLLKIENGKYVVSNVTRKENGNKFFVHFINYDHDLPAENIKVKLDLSDYVNDLSGYSINMLSPDEKNPTAGNIKKQGGFIDFTIDRIEHYSVAEVGIRGE